MRAPSLLAVMLALAITASLAASASLVLTEGLTYRFSISGTARGGAVEWLNVSGRVTYSINVTDSGEVAVPNASFTLNHSPGLEGVENAGFSIEALAAKLNSSKEFVVRDPLTGVLNPLFQLSISDVPAILTASCGGVGGAVESRNVSTTAALTTYEGRDSIEFLTEILLNYSDGSYTEIVTHSVIDLSTLEPLLLENNLSEASGNCSVEVRLRAVLENPGTLPEGGAHEFRVITSRGDAVIVVGGVPSVSGPVLSGEDSVTLTLNGSGRAVVIIAHTPSAGVPKILVGGKEVRAQTYRFGRGTAYTLKFLSLNGEAAVEVVFSNAQVALPSTQTPPATASTTTTASRAGGGADPLPYLLGAVAAVLGAVMAYFAVSRVRRG